MKKVITAINNPKLNEELKKEKFFEIIGKDIQYKEAILELLEKNKEIDIIVISENILGEIDFEKLIKKIKLKNEQIKIIFILEKENKELENILLKNNIKEIYYNNKINLKELIEIINKKEINIEEEIIKLKKIIEEKENNYSNNKNYNEKKEIKKYKFLKEKIRSIESRIKNKIKNRMVKPKRELKNNNMSTKIVSFSGNYKSGKSTLSLMVSQMLIQKNYKVLLIDADLEKKDLTTILKKEKKPLNKNRKKFYSNKKNRERRKNFFRIFFRKEKNKDIKLFNRKNKIYNYKIKSIIKKNIIKINKNFYLYPELNKILENKNPKEIKKRISKFFKMLKENYNYIIVDLAKNNREEINEEILKNSYTNFIVLEGNLLGIKEIHKLLELYIKEWKINTNSLHIIKNKKNFISVNRKLMSKYLSFKNKIFEIRENKFYYSLTNNYIKRNIILKNKILKKEINRIINKIIFD